MGMEYRHFYMARELKRLGHEVCVVASAYSHLRRTQPKPDQIGPFLSSHQGIDHIWLNGSVYRSNGIRRMFNMLGFSLSLWWHAKFLVKFWKPDVVYASSPHPLQSYGAVRLARLAGAIFVFEIRDLWPLSLIELAGVSRTHPAVRMLDHAERYGCNHADAVISLLPAVAGYMKSFRDLPLSKLHIIPNGISLEDWQDELISVPDELRNHIRSTRLQGNLIVGYAGSLGLPNALDTLLDAAALLKGKPINFFVVGDGHEKLRLQRRIDQESLVNVRLFSPIPKAQIPSFLQSIDVAFIGWQRQPIYRYGIAPNKLMDYMIAGCAVLHSVEAGNDPVAESGCGFTVPPESSRAIADALDRFIAMSPSDRAMLGEKGKEYVKKHHDYAVLARRFMNIVTQHNKT